MTYEQHRERHVQLSLALHELLIDWMQQTAAVPSDTSVSELVSWAQRQADSPTRNDFAEVHLPCIAVDRG